MVGDTNRKIKVGGTEKVSHASSVPVYILPLEAFKIAKSDSLKSNKTQASNQEFKTNLLAPSGNFKRRESYATLCFGPHLKSALARIFKYDGRILIG